jgi:hypothetical protein
MAQAYETTEVYDAPKTRDVERSASQEQAQHLEKTLHHLAGRVVELRARMERVLLPRAPETEGANTAQPERQRSPLADELYIMRGIANGAIREVEDILNRLDV